ESLTTVDGTFWLDGGAALANVDALQSLDTVGDGLSIGSLPGLRRVRLPALAHTPWLAFQSDDALTDIEVTSLASTGQIDVLDLKALARFAFPALTHLETLSLSGAPALTNLSVPALTTVDKDIRLTNVGLPSVSAFAPLTTIGGTIAIANLPA